MFFLINELTIVHHKPDDKVIVQNDPVCDDDNVVFDSSCMYFIMTGNYGVKSLMFDMQNKLKVASNEEANQENEGAND